MELLFVSKDNWHVFSFIFSSYPKCRLLLAQIHCFTWNVYSTKLSTALYIGYLVNKKTTENWGLTIFVISLASFYPIFHTGITARITCKDNDNVFSLYKILQFWHFNGFTFNHHSLNRVLNYIVCCLLSCSSSVPKL